jgi:putative peptidoglycan lipid II flippase
MKKTALILMALAVVSKIFGFGREIALSYFYGASNVSDAYLISLTIPGTIFAFIAAGIATGYIPLYTEIEKKNSSVRADKFTSNILNVILLICLVIVIFVATQTSLVVKLFASGFKGDTFDLAVLYTRISIFGIFFYGVSHILKGYLQIKGQFTIPALLGLPFNLIIFVFIVISSIYNHILLPYGIVVAMLVELIILIPLVYKGGYRHQFPMPSRDKYLKKMLFLAMPVILGTSVNQINTLVDRTLASQIVEGGISALNYASRLNSFVQGIFVISIATVMYPMISKMAANKDIPGLKNKVKEGIVGVNLLIMPLSVGAMILAEPVVKFLFGRGAFDTDDLLLTSSALYFYSIGMIGVGFREILSRAFYSIKDTKTPMINAAIGMVINIALNIVLSKFLGIGGLALATSISALITAVLMFVSLRKRIGSLGIKQIGFSFMKILIASLIMGLIVKLFYINLTATINQNLLLLLAVLIGAIIYCLIVYFMKIEYVVSLFNNVKKKLKSIK